MDININDKFIAKKKTWFLDEGIVVNVTNTDNGIISFVFNEDDAKRGRMDMATFESHFEKVEEKEEIPTITEEYIDEIMENSTFDVEVMFHKCTVVACMLPNGFVVTASSSCVNPDDFDAKLGEEICMKKIKDKIWELEAYRLQQFLWEEKTLEEAEEALCPCCCGDCEECEEYDNDECDCDDCEEYDCPFNPNC